MYALPRVRGWIGFPISDEGRTRFDAAIAERHRLAAEIDQAMHAALSGVESLAPRPDLGRCPVHLGRPSGPDGIGASVLPDAAPWPWLEATSLAEIAGMTSASASAIEGSIWLLERSRDRRWGSEAARDGALAELDFWAPPSREVVFVRTAGPAREDSLHARAEVLAGRAYVFDVAARRFACIAHVVAHHGDSIEYLAYIGRESDTAASITSALAGDLRLQLYTGIDEHAVPLGPPLGPALPLAVP